MKRIVVFILTLSLALCVACSSDKTQQTSSSDVTEASITKTAAQTSLAETTTTQQTTSQETSTSKALSITAATAAPPKTEAITVQQVTTVQTTQLVSQTQLNPEPENCFELKLFTDKAAYTTEDAITCWATLEYIGSNDSIMIYCDADFVIFSITDGKTFNPAIFYGDVGLEAVIKKGQVIRKENSFTGKWSIDSNGKIFSQNQTELTLPSGDYTITGTFDYSFKENNLVINRSQEADIKFSVQ